mmetsp:Transcript_38999/g.99938  ORF Transcript_38999/g.99938 Transcript_38999/m.99938 type:complete len:357 (-) Transcript_38999:80-1150(-)
MSYSMNEDASWTDSSESDDPLSGDRLRKHEVGGTSFNDELHKGLDGMWSSTAKKTFAVDYYISRTEKRGKKAGSTDLRRSDDITEGIGDLVDFEGDGHSKETRIVAGSFDGALGGLYERNRTNAIDAAAFGGGGTQLSAQTATHMNSTSSSLRRRVVLVDTELGHSDEEFIESEEIGESRKAPARTSRTQRWSRAMAGERLGSSVRANESDQYSAVSYETDQDPRGGARHQREKEWKPVDKNLDKGGIHFRQDQRSSLFRFNAADFAQQHRLSRLEQTEREQKLRQRTKIFPDRRTSDTERAVENPLNSKVPTTPQGIIAKPKSDFVGGYYNREIIRAVSPQQKKVNPPLEKTSLW